MATGNYGSTSSDMSERASQFGDAAGRQMDQAIDSAETLARNAAVRGRQALTAVDRTMRDQPMLTLAAVAAAGLVIGALWKMDRRRW